MDEVEKEIWDSVYNLFIKDTMQHNHPPCHGIVPGCEYCKHFGNIFKAGCIRSSDVNIKDMYAFKSKLGVPILE